MKYIPESSLAHYEQLPQTHLIKLSHINTAQVAANINAYKAELIKNYENNIKKPVLESPDAEAVRFYAFNHLAAMVKKQFSKHEILPDWATDVMKTYKEILVDQGVRLTAYTLLVIVRESRHCQNTAEWWKENIQPHYGPVPRKLFASIKGKTSSNAAEVFLSSPPSDSLHNIVGAIEKLFFEGQFSGGYGGIPWGHIARTLRRFIEGEISQEMMVDTAYTLAHNNGPMFNKEMLYTHYTADFKKILDVQRSGQVPEYIIQKGASGLTPEQYKVFTTAIGSMSEDKFGKYVDWYKVEAMGAMQTYPHEKIMQDKTYGKPKVAGKKIEFMGKLAQEVGEFAVAPSVSVKIVKRLETA